MIYNNTINIHLQAFCVSIAAQGIADFYMHKVMNNKQFSERTKVLILRWCRFSEAVCMISWARAKTAGSPLKMRFRACLYHGHIYKYLCLIERQIIYIIMYKNFLKKSTIILDI